MVVVALVASNKEMKKGIEYMLTWVWQPGSLYEIRATWGWYWAGCGMVKIIIKQGGAEHINQKYILRVATQKCLF